MTTVTIELPRELLEELGSDAEIAVRARTALILDLLKDARISRGKAAQLLGMSHWDLIPLMGRLHIESGPQTAEEVQEELDAIRQSPRNGRD